MPTDKSFLNTYLFYASFTNGAKNKSIFWNSWLKLYDKVRSCYLGVHVTDCCPNNCRQHTVVLSTSNIPVVSPGCVKSNVKSDIMS